MTLHIATSAVALVCYTALVYITAQHNLKIRVNRWFTAYLIAMVFWQITLLMVSLSISAPMALFWYKLMIVAATAQFPIYYLFTRTFLHTRAQKWVICIGVLSWLTTLVLIVGGSPHYIAGIHRDESTGLFVPDFGVLLLIAAAIGYFLLASSVFNLVRGYKRARSALERIRLRHLLLGVGAVMVGTLANFVPTLQGYPIDVLANLVNALLIAYAILRYQLLDITLVIRKGLVYSSLTALVAAVYFFTVFVFTTVFHTLLASSLILAILIASAIAVAFQPMHDRAQLLIDRLFFREKYDAQLMLQELSKLATSILDINELTSLLLDRLTSTMHVKQACIMLEEKENARFHLIAQKGQSRLEDGVMFREDHPVVRWMVSHKGALTRHDLDVLPQFKALWTQEREDLDRTEAELFVPLLVREELVGIFILGPKRSEALYSPDEQLTLTTLANQTAVAIQNAWLYSDLAQSLEDLKRMQAQLIQTEKLSAIGEMIASVAHEINNPLTAVIGYAQLMRGMDLDSQVKQDLGQILEAGLRVKRIVANLLDFSRQHPPQKEYIDINQAVSKALELRAHDLITSNIRIETNLAPGLPRTMADPYQFEQVFVNIINNAQQAMAERGGPGVLTVMTRRGKDNTILISFQDTGLGIPQEIMNRIFDPFFTTKEVGKGTGLGLSVSYGIVQEHEGHIWAESEDGRGATFFIELPIRSMTPAIKARG